MKSRLERSKFKGVFTLLCFCPKVCACWVNVYFTEKSRFRHVYKSQCYLYEGAGECSFATNFRSQSRGSSWTHWLYCHLVVGSSRAGLAVWVAGQNPSPSLESWLCSLGAG